MTKPVREWLPWAAAASPPIKDAVEAAVQSWSETWFAKRRVRMAELSATAGARRHAEVPEAWRVFGSTVAVRCSRSAASRLVSSCLDLSPNQVASSDADRRLLNALEDRLLSDLCSRIETALGVDGKEGFEPSDVADPYQGLGGAEVNLADGQGLLSLVIAIPLAATIRLCKSSLPAARRPTNPIASLDAAVDALPIRLEATLGAASLSVSELESLGLGDVITLPATLDAFAELRLCDTENVVGRGRLSQSSLHRALVLESVDP